jgi:hypothetical protein
VHGRRHVILNRETYRHSLVGLRAVALASILLLPGCATLSHHDSPVVVPPVAVRVLTVSDPAVKVAPDPVSDAEISSAQAALRDALAWGAQFYEPQMYAKAETALDAAVAARVGNPVRCRSLLAEATQTASSAKGAALLAYEADVKSRFEASRARLVDVGADRAFPDEFARLVSGIDATAGLFAAASYQDARLEAYHTLKGMSDLYETIRGLLDWLRDAQIRVESAIGDARSLDAPTWAPAEMRNAEQKYHDALAQKQAGDLRAAADSMEAAGQIALRLPFLRKEMDKRGTSVPLASRATSPEPDKEVRGPNPGPLATAAARLLPGQRVRIGDISMSSLGAPQKLYLTFQAAVARFDVVAAEGLRDAGIMEKVLAGMDESWEAAVSRSGYFGFIYNDRIQMVKDLGTYPEPGEFFYTPYAAQFRLVGTRFLVNLVLCHIEADKDRSSRTADVGRLSRVYRYFENLTGNRGITLLLTGGLKDDLWQASESLAPRAEMVPLRANLAAAEGRHDHGQRMFASAGLQVLVEESGLGASSPPVAYVTLGGGK